MSALAMVLAAGLAIGDGPGKASGEVANQSLPTSGVWRGDVWSNTATGQVELAAGRVRLLDNGQPIIEVPYYCLF